MGLQAFQLGMSDMFAFGKTYQAGTGCPAVAAGAWSEIPADGLGVIVRYDDILQNDIDQWRGRIEEDTARRAFLQAIEEFEAGEIEWERDMPPAIDHETSREWGRKIADALDWNRTRNERLMAVA